ncbi:MAG: TonB-dependent receptor [Bacteroidia bacterium]|nr:TonB-dependent receptor [Bacteroidia bacterium]
MGRNIKKTGLVLITSILMSGIVVGSANIPPSDSLTLDTVNVNGHKYGAYSSVSLIDVSSAHDKFKSLADLVEQAGISVRSNGVGQLTLASVRGLYGNQMNLLWEGINIQSPMNGNFDLSLIPGFFLDNASIIQNNYSSLSGNAALSGSLVFSSNKEVFGSNKYSAHIAHGSFGSCTGGIDVILSNNKLYSRTRVFGSQSQNNYPILGYEHTPFRKRQINNDFSSCGLLQEWAVHTGKKGLLNVKAWFQITDRGLTDAISVPNSISRQQDKIQRVYADWESIGKNKVYFKSAFFDEKILFKDNQAKVFKNHTQTLVFEFGQKIILGRKSRLNFGVNETLNKGIVNEYNGIKLQNLLSGFVTLESQYKKINFTVSVREQFHNYRALLPTPSFEVYYFINTNLKLRANSGLSYRIPTFNDLYWTPGGNSNLNNEQALKNEIGADYTHKNLIMSVSIYHNEVRNLIVWQDNGVFWEAQNIRGARVFGAEFKVKTTLIDRNLMKCNAGAFASINHSVYTRTEAGSEDIIGNQLIFIPLEMANGFVDFKISNFFIKISEDFAGKRYISTDNSSYLGHYFLTNVGTGYKFKVKTKTTGELGLSANNLFNKGYELYKGRPMMGRNFLLMLNIWLE